MHIRHYYPQDHIIRRSEQSSAMFYVLRGAVKVVSHDNEATYYEIKENNFFGDVGVLYRVPRSMDVLAKNRCTIAILSGDDLVKAMEQSPEMAKAIGYQTQERYQIYLKRRQSMSVRRSLDGGPGGLDQCQDDSRTDSFAKSDVHNAIRKVPLFQCCSAEVIHLLSLNVEPRTYNLGETIIRRGEIGREMFFIASGVVEILSDDNLRVLARFKEGQFFGEIAVLLDVPRIANVKAVSEVEVFVLTKNNLEAVFQAVPGAAEAITREGHRLYKNWSIRNTLQSCDESMEEGEKGGIRNIEQEMNFDSLNLPRGGPFEPSVQKRVSQDSDSGLQFSDQQDPFGPSDASRTDISVLPMTDEFPLAQYQNSTSLFVSPMPFSKDLSSVGPFDEVRVPVQESDATAPLPISQQQQQQKQQAFDSSFDQGIVPEHPVDSNPTRNPTIRGLQLSNPKRRRASVAVWSQQDLLKIAEATEAKTTLGTTFAPSTSTNMAISITAPTTSAVTDDHQKSLQRRKSSNTSLLRNGLPIKKRTGPATFQDFDDDIVAQILDYLPLDRLLRARRVCKNWNNMILESDDILQEIDLSLYKKIVTDAFLTDLCSTILSKKPHRATKVSLRDCFLISDKGLILLASHMPAVQYLDLHSCWNVTDNGFKSLGLYCPKLCSIDFSNCRKLGDETIFALYPKEFIMEELSISPKKRMDEKLLSPQPVSHICTELAETIKQDDGAVDISMDETQTLLAHRLSIEMESPTDHGSESNSPLSMDIETPRFSSPKAIETVSTNKGCPSLARLNLSYCKNLTDKSFIHLSLYGSKRLEYLNLQRCTTITSEGFISLNTANNNSADQQNFTNGSGYQGYSPLSNPCFPKLRELHLSDCTFLNDQAIVSLAPNMPNLQVVSLSFCCALTDIAIEALSENCLFIKKMDLSFCGSAVSDSTLYQMARFDALEPGRHSLQELEIRGCVRVTERGIIEILNGCANLKRLNVSSCSGIGSGDLLSPQVMEQPQEEKKDVVNSNHSTDQTDSNSSGPGGAWASLPNASQNTEMIRKMNALKKGKEWALAQQRPGLVIVV
ncbi:hypothetical protein BGZ76_000255 [Entomortierella beljakovae]|nr:hypothetical protein BGZ76_000255 [Entomortierella beljakovae]